MPNDIQTVDHRNYRRDRPVNGKHDHQSKLYALSVYAESNSQSKAAEVSGIPITTIHTWLKEEESDSYVESLRNAARTECAHQFLELMVIGCGKMKERMLQGDPHVTKDGEIIYLPVRGRDISAMTSQAADKLVLLTAAAQAGKAATALQSIAAELMATLKAKTVEHQPSALDRTERAEPGPTT